MAGIYVHFPFCRRKCIYCNFYSVADTRLRDSYFDALCREIELTSDFLPDKHIDTLYFGGGTPSLCAPAELERIANKLRDIYVFSDDLEWTMEANPEQLDPSYLADLKELGINRLSIGVQSFDDRVLQLLHRGHSAEQARRAVENAAAAGFQNLSLDLIYDIAYRTREMWQHDLQTALSLPVTHLSAYSLTVEENTLLARKVREGAPFVAEELDAERDYLLLKELSEKAGFVQYEISNFAKDGAISRHNFSYWTGEPYLGLGPAAHSFRSPLRRWNVADILRYVAGVKNESLEVGEELLTPDMQYDEYVLLRLRTSKGVDVNDLERRFGSERRRYFEQQLQKTNEEYYHRSGARVMLTFRGTLFADAISAELFSE